MKKFLPDFYDESPEEFNAKHKNDSVPTFQLFLQAFEQFSKEKPEEYDVRTLDNVLLIRSKTGEVYEMDTTPGLKARLRDYVSRKSLDEILHMTNGEFWNDILNDPDLKKDDLALLMIQEWHTYWNNEFETADLPRATLERERLASRADLHRFADNNSITDMVDTAFKISEYVVYPILILAALRLFDAEICYEEYADMEFWGDEGWEVIVIKHPDSTDSDDKDTYFFIRQANEWKDQ